MQNAVCTMHLILLVAALLQASVAASRQHKKSYFQEIIATTEREGIAGAAAESSVSGSVPINPENGIRYNSYSKHHSGRHVCTTQKNMTQPVKTKESYCKPVYKKYVKRCHNNQLCTGVRLVCETAYRDVVIIQSTTQATYACCPGWRQVHNRSFGCNKGQCSVKCQNGGTCVKPNWCSCPKGFTGRYCEQDINECKEQKPCDQTCHNTFGSYRCECRDSFILQSDGQSCHKADGNGPAFEAKDLEYGELDKRLYKLEMLLSGRHNVSRTEIQKITRSIEKLSKEVNLLKHKFKEMEK